MPIITAAVAAVSIAAAVTTAATVATAIVTVAAAIGTIGLAVSAVGLITGNQDLLKAGEIMGYIGIAGAGVGGLVGGIGAIGKGGFMAGAKAAFTDAAAITKSSWDKGVGSWFDEAAGAKVTGVGGKGAQTSNFTQAQGAQPGIGEVPPTSIGPSTETGFAQPQGKGYIMQAEGAAPGPAAPTYGLAPPPVSAPSAPINVIPQGPGAPSVVPSTTSLYPSGNVVPQVNPLQGGGGILNVAAETATASTLPDWVKYTAMTTGAQGITGALGGWFQGASAEQKMELEKLINSQNQAQVQYLNKNNRYAPAVRFAQPSGVLNR